MFTTRTRSLVAGLAALGVVAGAPAAHAVVPRGELAKSPELAAQPTIEPTATSGDDLPLEPVTTDTPEVTTDTPEVTTDTPDATDAPEAPATDAARTVGTGGEKPPRPVATETSQALEVDGVPGGYSRQKCERLAQQWESQMDKALDNFAQAGGMGPQLESAMSYMEDAAETYNDMSDNCLIVDPQ